MEKVYLLLRNNVQTGPFTLQQLQNQGLRPTDLVWVEGDSMRWHAISEIGELQPGARAVRKSEANHTQSPSSLAGGRRRNKASQSSPEQMQKENSEPLLAGQEVNLERWATSIRERAELYAASHPVRTYKHPETPAVNPYRFYRDDNPIDLVVHGKGTNTINGFQLIMVAAITVIIAGSWYGEFSIIPERKLPLYTSVASAPTLFKVEPKKVVQQPALQTAIPTDSSAQISAAPAPSVQPVAVKTRVSAPPQIIAEEETRTEAVAPAPETTAKTFTAPEKTEKESISNETKETVAKKQETEQATTAQTTLAEDNSSKKKTLGQALKGLFKKKKKGKEEPVEPVADSQ